MLLNARRADGEQAPAVSLGINMRNAGFYSDGQRQELTDARLKLSYDFGKDTIELADSIAQFGETVFPLSGGIIDLDRLPEGPNFGKGFGLDLVVSDGQANVPTAGEVPFPFALKAMVAIWWPRTSCSSIGWTLRPRPATCAARCRCGSAEPGLKSASMPTCRICVPPSSSSSGPIGSPRSRANGARKPLWRCHSAWNDRCLHPQNRLSIEPKPVRLSADELKIGFDLEDARLNLTGDLPPLRDVFARFDMVGERSMSRSVPRVPISRPGAW